MDLAFIAFIVFALTAVASALAVISVKNPVHAVLSLVLTFFSVACLWIIIGAEFLGVTLILVYVGAVMVLFLFVVMMLDIDVAPLREGFVRYLPVGLLVAAVILSVAVSAAVTLTLRRREGAKHQNPGAQARVRAGDRVRLVKMQAVRPSPVPDASDAGGADVEVKP